MAQFFVYQNKNTNTKKTYPLLLDVQSNLLESLQTTVVIPLIKYENNIGKSLGHLTPVLSIEGSNYLMVTPQLAGISKRELGKAVGDMATARTEIINALDFLITGV